MKVDFKFEPKQKVETVTGDTGVIDSCSIVNENAPNRYYILMKEGRGAWFDEDQLKPVE